MNDAAIIKEVMTGLRELTHFMNNGDFWEAEEIANDLSNLVGSINTRTYNDAARGN
jgi:hypothetical protein